MILLSFLVCKFHFYSFTDIHFTAIVVSVVRNIRNINMKNLNTLELEQIYFTL